jgi:LmbE family N-acetylglucosaminyl deacetylase
MIFPLIDESAWMRRLRKAPAWKPSDAPMVIVAPHPDDETLAVGGLIAAQRKRGVDVTVVAVTDGEHAYAMNQGLGKTRREEQASALTRLGVPRESTVRLGLVDSGVTDQEGELVERLQSLITAGTQVLAPWRGDFHPDHEACARAADLVSRRVGATLISYFFWTWHRSIAKTLDGLTLRKFVLGEEMMVAKREALACHSSQLQHTPEPEILPESLLWPARMPFEVFAL